MGGLEMCASTEAAAHDPAKHGLVTADGTIDFLCKSSRHTAHLGPGAAGRQQHECAAVSQKQALQSCPAAARLAALCDLPCYSSMHMPLTMGGLSRLHA